MYESIIVSLILAGGLYVTYQIGKKLGAKDQQRRDYVNQQLESLHEDVWELEEQVAELKKVLPIELLNLEG